MPLKVTKKSGVTKPPVLEVSRLFASHSLLGAQLAAEGPYNKYSSHADRRWA